MFELILFIRASAVLLCCVYLGF